MNFYVDVINDIVEHIECNIGASLQLADLSSRAGISDFHFNRMFKTVAGVTLKQYVLGRKLASAMEQLACTNKPIIDIALDLGFEYPEVFSRAFKKQFGISPSDYRQHKADAAGIRKASIVERDIINYRGTLALKGNCRFLDAMRLYGILVKADTNAAAFESRLRLQNETFLLDSGNDSRFQQDLFFTIVSCDGTESGLYDVFCGREIASPVNNFYEYAVPGGWYADFVYHGDMFDIREVFIDDLYKWLLVKEAQISPNGIGMLNIYESDYSDTHQVHICIPIQKPV